MYQRLAKPLQSNSFFLFGSRGTGKSTLIKELIKGKEVLEIDLLDPREFEQFIKTPGELSHRLEQRTRPPEWVFIDEVQKVPRLLDAVHLHIEKDQQKFILTGSSARKLRRGAANLLAGRAFVYHLFPLTHRELKDDFNLDFTLAWGSLPKILSFKEDAERSLFLQAYCDTYVREEILVEQLVRNLPPFRRFLEVAAQSDGEVINYSQIARDILSDPKAVQGYFEILEDTLIGILLQPYHQSIRKRQRQNPKFYWFDTGVVRALNKSIDNQLLPGTFEYGKLFESFVINEVHRLLKYSSKAFSLSYLRTRDDIEIDLIVERAGHPTALVEIKATRRIHETHVNRLSRIAKDFPNGQAYCFSQDPVSKKIDNVECLHWQQGLQAINI